LVGRAVLDGLSTLHVTTTSIGIRREIITVGRSLAGIIVCLVASSLMVDRFVKRTVTDTFLQAQVVDVIFHWSLICRHVPTIRLPFA
jgi:hypothetical protein